MIIEQISFHGADGYTVAIHRKTLILKQHNFVPEAYLLDI